MFGQISTTSTEITLGQLPIAVDHRHPMASATVNSIDWPIPHCLGGSNLSEWKIHETLNKANEILTNFMKF